MTATQSKSKEIENDALTFDIKFILLYDIYDFFLSAKGVGDDVKINASMRPEKIYDGISSQTTYTYQTTSHRTVEQVIHANDGKFLEWVKFLFTYVEAHATAFGLDPRGFDDINALISAYEQAYETAEDPNRGKADVIAKNETRDALKKAVRQYVREYLTNNHLVTDEDRRHMALPVHDVKPTPAPKPTDAPVGEVDFSRRQRHGVHVKAGTLTGRSKPLAADNRLSAHRCRQNGLLPFPLGQHPQPARTLERRIHQRSNRIGSRKLIKSIKSKVESEKL
jgi:hypothetical protein